MGCKGLEELMKPESQRAEKELGRTGEGLHALERRIFARHAIFCLILRPLAGGSFAQGCEASESYSTNSPLDRQFLIPVIGNLNSASLQRLAGHCWRVFIGSYP
jgi:hypothetical protein